MSLKDLKNRALEILTFLCLILIGFKCSGSVIAANWSWWMILSPLSIAALNVFVTLYKLSGEVGKNHNNHKKHVYIE